MRAWQNGQTLYADQVVLDRGTDVVTATGNVVLSEPGGETIYAQHVVLSKGMKKRRHDWGVAARLAQNGRMIANGGQAL